MGATPAKPHGHLWRSVAQLVADLLVVDGDLAADVTALARPTAVWVGGVAVER